MQTHLLNAFCPVLRFDASEKHFPVSVERFISSSLLLRKKIPPHKQRRQNPGRHVQHDGAGPPDPTTLEQEVSSVDGEPDEVGEVDDSSREGHDAPVAGERRQKFYSKVIIYFRDQRSIEAMDSSLFLGVLFDYFFVL